MSLGRSAGRSDPGRRRRRNEDSFVCQPPLFAVADGMGGAQAGELASRLAATALEEASRAEAPLDLVAAIREGNRRINARSLADPATAGMGTTVTAVLVGSATLSIGHVGDSRAYRLRGERFEQLTADHSLVAELVRSGQLAPEEADGHPQRAVITRALGTDANVEVDFFEVASEPGDVYLLCSDGLTTMLADKELQTLLAAERHDLEAAAGKLIAAANAAGGEDNITVVCFEIVDDEDTLSGLDTTAAQTMVLPPAEASAGWSEEESGQDDAPTAELAIAPQAPARTDAPAAAAPAPMPAIGRYRKRRKLPYVIALLALIAVAAAGGLAILSRAHFVGVDSHDRVVVYQGVPWNIARGVHLYRAVYISPVLAVELSQQERLRLFDHALHSRKHALTAVRAYERELLR